MLKTQEEIPPPSLALWVWTVVMALSSSLVIARMLYEAVTSPSARDEFVSSFVWVVVWGAVVVRAIQRQDLTPTWFWAFAGATSGLLVVVPIWHHGREWKSTWRKWAAWTWFVLIIIWASYFVLRELSAA